MFPAKVFRRSCIAALLSFLAGLFGTILSFTSSGAYLEEELGLNFLFRLRGPQKPPAEVVIVTIDKASTEYLQLPDEPEKWPRNLHADLIRILTKYGASLIAFNIIFNEGREPSHDQAMAQAMIDANNVLLSEYLKQRTITLTNPVGTTANIYQTISISPIPIFKDAAILSSPFPLPKGSSNIRQLWTDDLTTGGLPTFPISVFECFVLQQTYDEFLKILHRISPERADLLPKSYQEVLKQRGILDLRFKLKGAFSANPGILHEILHSLDTNVSNDFGNKKTLLRSWLKSLQDDGNRYFNHYGPPGTITTIPYYKVIQQFETVKDLIAGKVVFIGYAENLQPEKNLGFYTVFSHSEGLTISTVEIAATAFANFVQDAFVQPLEPAYQALLIICWGILLVLLCQLLPLTYAVIGTILLSTAYLAIAYYKFCQNDIWLPVSVPLGIQAPLILLSYLCYRYIKHTEERESIRKAFCYYIPTNMVEKLIEQKNIQDFCQTSQLMYGVCLATDAGKYTTLAESTDPMALGNLMNEYYASIFPPVKRHGGIISDVIGDAMLAIWATEQIDSNLRINACRAALDIQEAVTRFNQARELKLPTRIGLHYGPMRLGNVGSAEHYEFRAVGDIVNTATRIEGLNKALGTRILISAETLAQLDEFYAREVGMFLLEGKQNPLAIYELMGYKENANPELVKLASRFSEALELFKTQQWDKSFKAFLRLVNDYPCDGPSIFYAKHCRQYRDNPEAMLKPPIISIAKNTSPQVSTYSDISLTRENVETKAQAADQYHRRY
jgi:adenylate cyclase